MVKYSIVMTHYERLNQLKNTLDSIGFYIGSRNDFEIIIVDDFSPSYKYLRELVSWYSMNIRLISSSQFHKEKTWCNPCIPFNIGLKQTLGDIVILQNAENFWKGNILEYLDNNFSENDYVVFGCYSINEIDSRNFSKGSEVVMQNKVVSKDGESGWYQHSRYRNNLFHFCSAISKTNLEKINYFDEEFQNGSGYEDNYFLHQISRNNLNIYAVDEPFVIHQYHYSIVNPIRPTVNNLQLFLRKINQ